MSLPKDICLKTINIDSEKTRLFIVAEGFEKRSFYWIKAQQKDKIFDDILICKYVPSKESLYEEMVLEAKMRSKNIPKIMPFDRYNPTEFEQKLYEDKNILNYDEIYIDISVMSKLLIMIIIFFLKKYNKKLIIIYTEPESWCPTQEEFENADTCEMGGEFIGLSSVGVHDIVKTPMLSSIVMQNSPVVLVAFLSFNEQLIKTLLLDLSPSEVILFNASCSRADWREKAMVGMAESILEEFDTDNTRENWKLKRTYEVDDCEGVFTELAAIYRENCYSKRIIISPTGGKWHALACALFKICCHDIHIEYPSPESYCFNGYSSAEIYKVHSISFDSFKNDLINISNEYKLNG